VTAAVTDNDGDNNAGEDAMSSASHTTSHACATLSAAAARLKSLALKLSHRLAPDERLRISESVATTLNLVLNSR